LDSDQELAVSLMGGSSLTNLHFGAATPARLGYVHSARQTRIKRMNGAQDFDGAIGVRNGRLQQSGLIRAALPFRVARTGVPGGRNHALIIFNGAVFDFNPVAKGAARRLMESPTLRGLRPS